MYRTPKQIRDDHERFNQSILLALKRLEQAAELSKLNSDDIQEISEIDTRIWAVLSIVENN